MVSSSLYKHHLLFLLCVVFVGISKTTIFFAVYSFDPTRIFSPDSDGYEKTAQAFLQTGRFAVSPEMPDTPQIQRTPGYPFFIATIYFFFGNRYPPLILVQILISLGTILLTYLLATSFWGSHVAVISAFLLSLDLPSFVNSQKVLTDTLFTFVLTLAILVGIYVLKASRHPVVL